jgi:uncharacterized membrane protein
LTTLNDRHGSYGPVLGGAGDGVEVTLSLDEPTGDKAAASARMLGAVTEALIQLERVERPASIELERI